MGDLLRSLTKPHTVVVRWLNGDNIGWKGTRGAQWRALDLVLRRMLQYRLKGDQGSPVEGVRPCPVGVVTLSDL